MALPVLPILIAAGALGKGIMDQSKAKGLSGKADALASRIPGVDPNVQGYLHDIQQRMKYAENGQNTMLGVKRNAIDNAGAQAATNLRRVAGTGPGAVQQAMLRNQAVTQQNLARAGAESEAQVPQYLGMQGPVVSDMADRVLSLQTRARDKADLQAAQTQLDANNMISGSLGILSGALIEPTQNP